MAAIINLQQNENRITIASKLYLYGSEANQQVGELIVEEINRMYNEPKATVAINGALLNVLFDIHYQIISSREALEMATVNDDYRNNFIRIENENKITRSFMGFGLGDNSGHWLTTDNLGTSTTAAHEFGHSLGLDHPENPDFRGSATPPPIMAARGSIVDAKYQWNPLAKAGEYGGTMNPVHRRVSQEEIALILEGLTFETTDTYYVGYLSNKLFNSKGSVVEGLA
ncbi:peptidase M10 [Dyadobacter psychrotolerans]|uniref:Peptidase M10 n=1 Tax=Dyadobacter psychrotolerans TaxID=2541721 RepID=A0A4R5DF44_9BACT|nr:peptidase M10 [Dyadobacter psychrotolerans]TDE12516.1 peptidase M10 [Dyadobacter psychrotolerans]